MAFLVIPSTVIWSYAVGCVVMAIGLVGIFVRGDWQKARGFDKLILLGPLFYAGPLAAFGTEHFTLTKEIASIVPSFIPWHVFVTYLVGTCFLAATLSIATGIETRLAATLLALNFFLFVILMDGPVWLQGPRDRFLLVLTLRESTFASGALALAASLTEPIDKSRAEIMATVARYVVAVTLLVYSVQQFVHGEHVPGVPLEALTPGYVWGHALWSYVAAAGYAVTGALLIAGKKTRAAATWAGITVLFVELVVYLPIAIVERASLDKGLNFFGDTLMFGGAVLLLAGAMPTEVEESSAVGNVPTQAKPA